MKLSHTNHKPIKIRRFYLFSVERTTVSNNAPLGLRELKLTITRDVASPSFAISREIGRIPPSLPPSCKMAGSDPWGYTAHGIVH